ncbi:MAG TPA: HU family DNA-binding protein [Gemmatimonadales bacterium]|nr:HU family DNA-binding protein [Gemmatimonadales bacterium]
MNKQELVTALARRLDCSKAHAALALDALFAEDGVIAGELRKSGKVQIAGFGNFELRKRAAREGRNPRTGKAIHIRASTVAAFRPAKGLKDLVNKRRG